MQILKNNIKIVNLCNKRYNQTMAKNTIIEDTPLIKQFFSIKAQHPEAVLLYRVGDFYETYSDDAILASKVLVIVLTKTVCPWQVSHIMPLTHIFLN